MLFRLLFSAVSSSLRMTGACAARCVHTSFSACVAFNYQPCWKRTSPALQADCIWCHPPNATRRLDSTDLVLGARWIICISAQDINHPYLPFVSCEPQAVKRYEILIRGGLEWCSVASEAGSGREGRGGLVMDAVRCPLCLSAASPRAAAAEQSAGCWMLTDAPAIGSTSCSWRTEILTAAASWRRLTPVSENYLVFLLGLLCCKDLGLFTTKITCILRELVFMILTKRVFLRAGFLLMWPPPWLRVKNLKAWYGEMDLQLCYDTFISNLSLFKGASVLL